MEKEEYVVKALKIKINYLIFIFLMVALILSSVLASIYIAVTGISSLEIQINENNTEIEEKWNIFDKVIYPNKSGYYRFNITNECSIDTNISILFADENPYQIPIVYRLYTNDKDLCGSEDKWITIEELRTSNIIIKASEKLPVTLEWKWNSTDDEFDTMIGNLPNAYYTIKVDIRARLK